MPRRIKLFPQDRILVCRTDRIGDLILTIPLIESLKARCPENEIDVLASEYAAPVLEYNPNINEIIGIDPTRLAGDSEYFERVRKNLKTKAYQAALLVFPERIVCRLIRGAGMPYRIGTVRRLHSFSFNRFLFHSRKRGLKHESEYNLDFLKFFPGRPYITVPRVYITDKEKAEARRLLSENNVNGRVVVIHPGSGGSARDWPLGNFAELTRKISENGISVILTGSVAEKEMIECSGFMANENTINLAGQTDLRLLGAVMSLADLSIANSTGPLHLAAAVGTRVIGFYPNDKIMGPKRWEPLGEGHAVFYPAPGKEMNSIAVEQVYEQAMMKLSGEGAK